MTADLMKTRIPAFRDEGWVCLSAAGLNMLARLGFEMMRDNEPKWKEYVGGCPRSTGSGLLRSGEATWFRRTGTASRLPTSRCVRGVEVLKKQIGWTSKVQETEIADGPDLDDVAA